MQSPSLNLETLTKCQVKTCNIVIMCNIVLRFLLTGAVSLWRMGTKGASSSLSGSPLRSGAEDPSLYK